MSPIPEYLRIRAYIINYINSHDRKSMLIPPENELCRIFNVTRPTVRNAIKGLVNDNYLIPRRGMGTYINPNLVSGKCLSPLTVGVIRGDGRHVNSPTSPELGLVIKMNGMDFQPLYLSNSDDPQRIVEFIKNGIEAVICEYPSGQDEIMAAIKNAGIPLLDIGENKHDSVDCILYPQNIGQALAEYAFGLGHRKMLFVHNHTEIGRHAEKDSWLSQFCRKMHELSGEKHTPEDCFVSLGSLAEKLQSRKEGHESFSFIYAVASNAPRIAQILEQEKIKVPEDLSFIAYGEAEPRYFNLKTCAFIDYYNPLRDCFFKWTQKRLINKDLSGAFFCEIDSVFRWGETLKNKTSKEVTV